MSDFPSQKQDKFVLRLPDGMRDRIKVHAEANGRSMNAEIIHRLEASFEIPSALSDHGPISVQIPMNPEDNGEAYRIKVKAILNMFSLMSKLSAKDDDVAKLLADLADSDTQLAFPPLDPSLNNSARASARDAEKSSERKTQRPLNPRLPHK
ncbi:MAG: Arc family DNA-binding protein [Pseudomonadota bacterium]